MRRTDKDLAGWAVDRKIEFLDEFMHIVNETTEHGFAAILKKINYEYYCKLNWPRGIRRDSKYTVLFRAIIATIIGNIETVPRWAASSAPKVNVVLESGHRNAQDVVRFYDFVAGRYGWRSQALAGLTFETKQTCLPIAAADLFAYSVFGQETGQKPIGVAKMPTKADLSYRGNLWRIELGREQLDALFGQALGHASASGSQSVVSADQSS